MTTSPRSTAHRLGLAFATLSLLAILGACSDEADEKPEEKPAETPQAAATPVKRTVPALPGPGTAQVVSRHGGLVAQAGEFHLELAVESGTAKLYVYGQDGGAVSGVTAKLTAKWSGGETTANLIPSGDGSLTGGSDLPNIFTAEIEVTAGGQSASATIRYAVGGKRNRPTSDPEPSAPQTQPGP